MGHSLRRQQFKEMAPKGWLRRATHITLWLSILFAATAVSCSSQTVSGTLAGTIQDESGKAIPGAKISIVGVSSGISYSAVSSDAGVYRVAGILPGLYNVRAVSPGFQEELRADVRIQVSVVSALDITLRVGTETQIVSVSASAPTLSTESSDVTTTITSRQVEELPLSLGGVGALRSVEAFVFLTPGTEGVGSQQGGGAGVFAQRISGGQAMGQEVLVDGASVDRTDWHSEIDETAPSVDALQEFTIESSTIPAEYSRTAGGVVTFVTKSGTNQYHGMLYDILKNDDLDANSWFSNGYIAQNGNTPAARQQYQRGADKKNDYGATIGGPIRIPRLYNGKDKSFFFFSWEQFRQSTGGTTTSTIPTTEEQQGDFSALLGPALTTGNGSPLTNPCDGSTIYEGQIFDPATTQTVNGQLCRTAFSGNVIDPSRFSNVAKNTIALLPSPQNGNLTQNYAYPFSTPVLNTTWTVRGDEMISSRQKLALTYSHRANTSNVGLVSLPYPLDPGHQKLSFKTTFARVIYDDAVTPNLMNSLILGYNRYDSAGKMPTASGGVDWSSKIGIGNVSPNDDDFPQFSFVDSQGLTVLGSIVNNESIDNGYRLNDQVSWVHGRHSIEAGVNAAYQEFAPNNFAGNQGAFTFSYIQTAPYANIPSTTGSAWASFLLGQVNAGSVVDRSAQPQWRSNYLALYGQDSYKLTHNLTVNYGINWSFETPRRELHNRASAWDPNLANPGANGALGALQFASSSNRTFTPTYLKDFSPRVGFSWAPDLLHHRTAIRGGYGIYYASLFYGDTGNLLTDGFTTAPNDISPDGFQSAFDVDNGFPAYTHAPFIDPSQDNGNSVSGYIEPGYDRPAYIQNATLQVQHQIAPDLIGSVAYVRSKGNRLRSDMREINALQANGLQYGTVLSEGINSADAQQAGIGNPFPNFQSIWGSAVNVGQALRRWPQVNFVDTGDLLENLGQSSYNALETQLERKFSNGLNLLISYTWAKTLTDADGLLPAFAEINGGGFMQNPYNRKAEKAVSNEDTPSVFVASYIYELPVGKGRKFLSHAPGSVNAVIGGWQISGVQRYQSGQPVQICCMEGVPDLDTSMRPSFTGSVVKYSGGQGGGFNPFSPTQNHWLHGLSTTPGETAPAFADPNATIGPFVPWQFGNVPRVYAGARSAKWKGEDFAILKKTQFTEQMNLEIRAEIFNALNRHVFSPGDTGIQDATFGEVFGTANGPRNIQGSIKLHF